MRRRGVHKMRATGSPYRLEELMPRKRLDLVAAHEIAERLTELRQTNDPTAKQVRDATVSTWILRGWPSGRTDRVKPPTALGTVAGNVAVFDWPDVLRWIVATGRDKESAR